MTEENIDVKTQEVVNPDNSTVNNVEENNSSQPTEKQEDSKQATKEYNWRKMEEKNEALARQVEELLEKDKLRNAPKPPVEEDELSLLEDDDIVTAAQARKLAERYTRETIKKAFKEKEQASLPDKTRSKFNDFDNIMTKENIKKLEQEEPGLAEACSKASNPWEATYKILKKFVLPPEERQSSPAEKKLDENQAKPGSINSVGKVKPLSQANMWSTADKDRLYKEMMRAARQV
jgi:hypothetical protein